MLSGLAETTAEIFGGAIGLTEILPIANILGKVHKNAPLSAKEKLVSALQSGAAEGWTRSCCKCITRFNS